MIKLKSSCLFLAAMIVDLITHDLGGVPHVFGFVIAYFIAAYSGSKGWEMWKAGKQNG